jgi:uncharacterized protein YjbJ (UPF0337 family)
MASQNADVMSPLHGKNASRKLNQYDARVKESFGEIIDRDTWKIRGN